MGLNSHSSLNPGSIFVSPLVSRSQARIFIHCLTAINFMMKQSEDNKVIPATSVESGKGHEVKPDVFYFTNQIVNVIMLSGTKEGSWVLVDTGMPKRANEVIEV